MHTGWRDGRRARGITLSKGTEGVPRWHVPGIMGVRWPCWRGVERDQTVEGFERAADVFGLNSEIQGRELFNMDVSDLPLSSWETPLISHCMLPTEPWGSWSPFQPQTPGNRCLLLAIERKLSCCG